MWAVLEERSVPSKDKNKEYYHLLNQVGKHNVRHKSRDIKKN